MNLILLRLLKKKTQIKYMILLIYILKSMIIINGMKIEIRKQQSIDSANRGR